MTRPDRVTIPTASGVIVHAGQRIRVKHGRTGRISVVEVVAAADGGTDVTASYADAATYKVKTLRNTLAGGKWRRKSSGQYPHHPDAHAGDLIKIKRRDGAVSTILLGGEKNRDGTWSDYTDVTPSWKKVAGPITWQDEWRAKAPAHRSGGIITVANKSGRQQNVILTGYDEESGTFGAARPTVEDYDSRLCDVETPGYGR